MKSKRSGKQRGRSRSLTKVSVVTSELDRGTNHPDVQAAVNVGLPKAGVDQGSLVTGVGSDQKHAVSLLELGNARVEEVVGAAVKEKEDGLTSHQNTPSNVQEGACRKSAP